MVTTYASAAWEELAPMPMGARASLGVAAVNGEVYVFGGTAEVGNPDTLHEYDPARETWVKKAPMPGPRSAPGVATLGGQVYMVGGGPALVHTYDPATDLWRRRASLPFRRWWLKCAAVGGKLYAIGGGSADMLPAEGWVDEYDPVSNTWTSKQTAPHMLLGFGMAVVEDRIYVTGGIALPGAAPNVAGNVSTMMYDPALDEWTVLADMPIARERHETVAVGGVLYAIAGAEGGGYVARISAYDVATDTWRDVGELPFPLGGHGTVVVDGLVYVFGGYGGHQLSWMSDKVLVWDTRHLDVGAVGKLATTWGSLRASTRLE